MIEPLVLDVNFENVHLIVIFMFFNFDLFKILFYEAIYCNFKV